LTESDSALPCGPCQAHPRTLDSGYPRRGFNCASLLLSRSRERAIALPTSQRECSKGGVMRRSTIVFASAVAMVLASCTGGKSPVTNPSGGGSGGSNASPRHGGTLDLTAQDDLTILDNSQAVSAVDYELTAGARYAGL